MQATRKNNNLITQFMPKGIRSLFFIQIFSTLSFSVLYSTLILYMTSYLHIEDKLATSITASFIALNYFLHLIGGYLGGRFLSYRSLFSFAMLLQLIGCMMVAIPSSHVMIWGLAVFLGGSGLNVTCINCLVTQMFEPQDKRRETAFLWNYSGMNMGFFLGFLIAGYFHLHQAYKQLFILSALGNLIALLIMLANWKCLADRDSLFAKLKPSKKMQARIIGLGLSALLIITNLQLLSFPAFCNQLILIIAALIVGYLFLASSRFELKCEQQKIRGYIILLFAGLIFWTLFLLAPMGLNLFIERNVDRHFMGFLVAPQWVQNINTIVIILGGPLLSLVFNRLRARGMNISIPLQFSLSLTLIGVGFIILPLGIQQANAVGLVNFNWILASFILQSLAELFISPIGYAMVGQLAPASLRGLMMGTWMMTSGVAATLSHHFSTLALGSMTTTDPLLTNASFSHTFNLLGFGAAGAGILLFVAVPFISRLTDESSRSTEVDGRKALQS